MKQVQLKQSIDINYLISNYNLFSYQLVDIEIGIDGKIYFLFNDHIPERIDGMFVNTQANGNCSVVVIEIDWNTGEVKKTDCINLGKQVFNYHYIQPFKDGFILVGARCYNYDSGPEQNVSWFDLEGNKKKEGCFGDGIADCIVTKNNEIVVSYFDEGIFGNYGWSDPIGQSGLIVFDENFNIKWESQDDICDCYAINLDDDGNIWYYYYDEFNLVKTDLKNTIHYSPDIEWVKNFLICDDSVLFYCGYDGCKGFYLAKIDALSELEEIEFVYENKAIDIGMVRFLQSKMVFLDDDFLYIANKITK